ncbi:hypothetical protein WA026_003595 [Henosepilachna vigintioctopunctata]|uniref:Uncharacterized protein n=1 Tax=Henosepilachna vigintioctopunctata TaxID=420089 RepID=A0AAW1TNG5_9CUCU
MVWKKLEECQATKTRKLNFFGYRCTKYEPQQNILYSKILGKCSVGRRRKPWLKSSRQWLFDRRPSIEECTRRRTVKRKLEISPISRISTPFQFAFKDERKPLWMIETSFGIGFSCELK